MVLTILVVTHFRRGVSVIRRRLSGSWLDRTASQSIPECEEMLWSSGNLVTDSSETCDEPDFLLGFSSLPPLWVLGFSSMAPLFSSKSEEESRRQRGGNEEAMRLKPDARDWQDYLETLFSQDRNLAMLRRSSSDRCGS